MIKESELICLQIFILIVDLPELEEGEEDEKEDMDSGEYNEERPGEYFFEI